MIDLVVRHLWLVSLVLYAGCVRQATPPDSGAVRMPTGGVMKLTSSAFSEGGMIPRSYTCDGENQSPPLSWTDVPPNTRAFALITEDPDAPAGTWIHWLVFNLPADLPGLPEGVPKDNVLENGAVQGVTSFRSIGYGGPCPPSGTHRYYFKLYALDAPLALTGPATARDVQAAMKEHILAEAALMGRYQRQR